MTSKKTGKAVGGIARAKALSPAKRTAIAKKGALARWGGSVKQATHGSPDHPLRIGEIEIPCYVLEDGTRVLSQRGLRTGLGMAHSGGSRTGEPRLVALFISMAEKGVDVKDLPARLRNPIRFFPPGGGRDAYGYEATLLPDICDVILAARKADALQPQQKHIAEQCEVLLRGFARVGIIALIDEATGFQTDRARNALSRILEAFIAKELKPWVCTFPRDYYEHLFRLRGLDYRTDTPKRPQYFGVLTNGIVYDRLAPGVRAELQRLVPKDSKGRRKHKLFQRLTDNMGHPKLREHLASVVTIMRLSDGYEEFKEKLDRIHPRFGETLPLPFDLDPDNDDGKGL